LTYFGARRANRCRFAGNTVPVLTGTELFHVHENVLVSSSMFLQNAMKPEWRTDTKPIDLSDEDPVHFQAYCEWLYTKKIVPTVIENERHPQLSRLYVLGGKLLDKSFQEDVLMAFISMVKVVGKYPSNCTIQAIYDGTSAGDPARRLMVDMWAFKTKPSWNGLQEDRDVVAETSTVFANDVIRALVFRRAPPIESPPWVEEPESYLADINGA
jgi:hypothetical protein